MYELTRDPGGDGRVVVIVGASSGIGRVLALRCARQGDALVLAARRSDLLHELIYPVPDPTSARATAARRPPGKHPHPQITD
jgi:NAD(P)-dependent dehydrogenase (short-subunit alcohol dehydrogenase family)